MTRDDIQWRSVPAKAGVYFFMGAKREILYIGRATTLQSRLKSYFTSDIKDKRSALIERMVEEAEAVEWVVTESVLEAMLLETNLIRTHKPHYNTISKDDKSYNHLAITNEEFPRVLVVRGKDIVRDDQGMYTHIYGPFPNGMLFKQALKIIRSLFKFYDGAVKTTSPASKVYKGKIDFNRQIGLYPEECTKKEYATTIRHIRLLFEGKKDEIIKDMERKMHAYAKKLQFEDAGVFKKKIFALKHIQDVALIKDEMRSYVDDRTIRIEAYDVAHLSGKNMVGVMTVIEGGATRPSEYRKFIIRSCDGANDTKALGEIIARRLTHSEWPDPALIVADGGTAQIRVIEKELEKNGLVIPVVGVVKDEHHKPKRILGVKKLVSEHKPSILLANAEAHRFAITFHRTRRLLELKK